MNKKKRLRDIKGRFIRNYFTYKLKILKKCKPCRLNLTEREVDFPDFKANMCPICGRELTIL